MIMVCKGFRKIYRLLEIRLMRLRHLAICDDIFKASPQLVVEFIKFLFIRAPLRRNFIIPARNRPSDIFRVMCSGMALTSTQPSKVVGGIDGQSKNFLIWLHSLCFASGFRQSSRFLLCPPISESESDASGDRQVL